jgi:hypothetical protein
VGAVYGFTMGGGKCFKKSSLLEHITAIKKGGPWNKKPLENNSDTHREHSGIEAAVADFICYYSIESRDII